MLHCTGFGTSAADRPLSKLTFKRRDVGKDDVKIEILYCGVCHSDLHFARNEWNSTAYPAVPGHEIVGRVSQLGSQVGDLNVGDHVGVGCLVDSCRTCPACLDGLEQYCEVGPTGTYGSTEKVIGGPTHGGYSDSIVVDRSFVLRIPEGMELSAAAPLLCAGITVYSPLRHWRMGRGKKVGIIGLGGLGHMGVKLAHAMEATTILFTSSASKVADGKRLGADQVIMSRDSVQMTAHSSTFDLIINTVSAVHDLAPYLDLLKRDGTMVQVGAPAQPLRVPAFSLAMKRRHFAGSVNGGIAETQEMLNFCATKNLHADVEVIPIQKVNEAYERMLQGDVKYRFSIDMATLLA
jgi:alcohol dehydrogenase (NADP+)